jgi:hypothetical protein
MGSAGANGYGKGSSDEGIDNKSADIACRLDVCVSVRTLSLVLGPEASTSISLRPGQVLSGSLPFGGMSQE